jgi:hypothetical protein
MVWITRIDFAGFGSLSGEKLEFEERKLNLVLESDSAGKITVFGALCATLFNFAPVRKGLPGEVTDRDRFHPFEGSGLPYISGADLFLGSRYLKIIRDFNEDAVQIVEMSKSNSDVTSEFFTADGTDEAGLKIVGMNRELFKRLSIVTCAEMSETRVGRLADLGRTMKELLAPRPFTLSLEQASASLNDALTYFPHQGKKLRAATVVRDLEGRFYELSEKVQKIEQDRKSTGLSLEAPTNVPQNFSGEDQTRLTQYFELCMECSEVDARLVAAQETLVRVAGLKAEINRIGSLDDFPIELQKLIEELFTRRQSRQQDYEAMVAEYSEKIAEFEEKQKVLATKYIGLDVFSAGDAQGISTLSREFNATFTSLNEFQQRKHMEIDRLRAKKLDIAAFSALRSKLQAMAPQDFEDAKVYDAEIIASRKQIDESEGLFGRERNHLIQIDRERAIQAEKNKVRSIVGGGLTFVGLGGSAAIYFLGHHGRWIFIDISLAVDAIFFIVTMVFVVLTMRPKYYMRKEHKATELDMNAQTRAINDLNAKLGGLEMKFDSLAQKVQFADGTELGARLREYTQKIPEFRELDNFEQLIKEREASLSNLRTGVEPYFARAGRLTEEIRPDTTTQLASEINAYVDEAREMLGVYGPITSAKEQIDFLKAEIQNAQKQLQASFIKARMEHLHDYNESYREFMTKVSLFQHLQTTKNELNGIENDMSSGFVPDELPPQIERLERLRRGKYMSMQELITRSPNIQELAPKARAMMSLMASINPYSTKASAEVTKKNIENLKAERDGMSVLVRSANTSDATYMLMLQDLRSVQAELTIVRRVKTALEYARDRITQVQPTPGLDLQLTISEIMEEMLTQMGIEAPKYESSLNDNDSGDPQNPAGSLVGKPFSLLTMEQVRWFARAIVMRVLAMNNSFPLVLNEPFGTGKEALRETNLPFIFSLIELRFQVMAMTSEATRFEAAYNAATAEQKMSLHTCARISLGS